MLLALRVASGLLAVVAGLFVGVLPSFFYIFGGLAFMKFLGLAFVGQ